MTFRPRWSNPGIHFGATCVVSEGGGDLNGGLRRAALVDELHLVTVPALVGGLGTPSIADGDPLPSGGSPISLQTVNITLGDHGSRWAHNEIVTRSDRHPTAPLGS